MMLATRDRKALDKLRDKCRRAYDRGAQRDEQKQLDEMGLRLTCRSCACPLADQLERHNGVNNDPLADIRGWSPLRAA